MNCPICDKRLSIPDVAVRNAECYGTQKLTITCSKCKGKVDAFFSRRVVVTGVLPSNNRYDDWGN